jgi:hypothetical protein
MYKEVDRYLFVFNISDSLLVFVYHESSRYEIYCAKKERTLTSSCKATNGDTDKLIHEDFKAIGSLLTHLPNQISKHISEGTSQKARESLLTDFKGIFI